MTLTRLLGRLSGERESHSHQVLTQFAVGEAVQRILAAHEDLEERALRAGHRIEGAHGAAVGRGRT